MRTPQSALDYYVRRYAFVREKIERLQRLADKHFGHDPNAVTLRAHRRPGARRFYPDIPNG